METHLSVVMVGRNDDYGGNLLHRLQSSLDAFVTLFERHELNAEIVLVDWNPPDEEELLADALRIPEGRSTTTVRHLTVPSDIHARFSNSDTIPLFEYVGKNAGVRRADGDYVLCTNVDIVPSDELVAYFADGNLERGKYYRTHRYDTESLPPRTDDVDALLSFCAESATTRTSVRNGFVPTEVGSQLRNRVTDAVSKATDLSKLTDTERVGQYLRDTAVTLSDTVTGQSTVATDDSTSESELYTLASGDFLLMARNYWTQIRGYPEVDTNTHVDSYGVCLAAAAGLQQVTLRGEKRVYHQYHDVGLAGRPRSDFETALETRRQILDAEGVNEFNDDDWGLAGDRLPERVFE
jgi:hypothetical protein